MPDLPQEPHPEGLVFRSPDAGPGLHVLLVGVSAYPYLNDGDHQCADTRGLGQIDCAARTAYEIFNWLERPPKLQLRHPLRTCRLLASPSQAELLTAPQLANALPATFDNLRKAVRAWRKDAATDRAGAALFYFAGHGIQRTRGDSLLLLSEFLDPDAATLAHSVDMSCIYDGMGEPNFPAMAQTQYYFIDACRTDLAGVQALADRSAPALWDVTLGGRDERVAPIFHGAGSGQLAYGSTVPGEMSAFGTDLLRCLAGGGAECVRSADGTSRWEVTIGTLTRSLPLLIQEANQARRLRSFGVDKWTDMDATITVLPDAPTVDCVLQIRPNGAESHALIDLTLGATPYKWGPPLKNPHPFQVKAGGYVLVASVRSDPTPADTEINAPADTEIKKEVVTVSPPRFTYSVVFP